MCRKGLVAQGGVHCKQKRQRKCWAGQCPVTTPALNADGTLTRSGGLSLRSLTASYEREIPDVSSGSCLLVPGQRIGKTGEFAHQKSRQCFKAASRQKRSA